MDIPIFPPSASFPNIHAGRLIPFTSLQLHFSEADEFGDLPPQAGIKFKRSSVVPIGKELETGDSLRSGPVCNALHQQSAGPLSSEIFMDDNILNQQGRSAFSGGHGQLAGTHADYPTVRFRGQQASALVIEHHSQALPLPFLLKGEILFDAEQFFQQRN
jgi:hypothetical protein